MSAPAAPDGPLAGRLTRRQNVFPWMTEWVNEHPRAQEHVEWESVAPVEQRRLAPAELMNLEEQQYAEAGVQEWMRHHRGLGPVPRVERWHPLRLRSQGI